MTIRATVAEFNPFHNGHKHLVDLMRKNGGTAVAIMSGNYVQRGGCSVYDKFTRARVAVQCGVDLVLELPLIYSLASAEYFARGAVDTLTAFGVIDELWFGSEAGRLEGLDLIADVLLEEPEEFKAALDENLRRGIGFAAARKAAAETVIGETAGLLDEPNNILGIEYLKAVKRSKSPIVPVTVPRAQVGHDSDERGESVASAKSLRESMKTGESIESYVPYPTVFEPVFSNRFDQLISYRLKIADVDELLSLPDCNEEIAARLKRASGENTLKSIIASAHTRAYADSRLRRILFNLVLGNRDQGYRAPTYVRALAFSKKGAEILRLSDGKAALPVVSRGGALKNDEIFLQECKGTDVYNLVIGRLGGEEFMYVPTAAGKFEP